MKNKKVFVWTIVIVVIVAAIIISVPVKNYIKWNAQQKLVQQELDEIVAQYQKEIPDIMEEAFMEDAALKEAGVETVEMTYSVSYEFLDNYDVSMTQEIAIVAQVDVDLSVPADQEAGDEKLQELYQLMMACYSNATRAKYEHCVGSDLFLITQSEQNGSMRLSPRITIHPPMTMDSLIYNICRYEITFVNGSDRVIISYMDQTHDLVQSGDRTYRAMAQSSQRFPLTTNEQDYIERTFTQSEDSEGSASQGQSGSSSNANGSGAGSSGPHSYDPDDYDVDGYYSDYSDVYDDYDDAYDDFADDIEDYWDDY